jgi:hypothetical protein
MSGVWGKKEGRKALNEKSKEHGLIRRLWVWPTRILLFAHLIIIENGQYPGANRLKPTDLANSLAPHSGPFPVTCGSFIAFLNKLLVYTLMLYCP